MLYLSRKTVGLMGTVSIPSLTTSSMLYCFQHMIGILFTSILGRPIDPTAKSKQDAILAGAENGPRVAVTIFPLLQISCCYERFVPVVLPVEILDIKHVFSFRDRNPDVNHILVGSHISLVNV